MIRTTAFILLTQLLVTPALARKADDVEPSEDLPRSQISTSSEESAEPEEKKEDPEEVEHDRVRSVQPKSFFKKGRFSLSPQGSLSINDPFYTKAAGFLTVAFYPRDTLAFGVRGGLLRPLVGDDLQTARSNFQTRIINDAPAWLVMAVTEWSPLYGKFRFGDSIHHFDGYVTAGFGLVATRTTNPAFEAGAGFRLGITQWLATNVSVQQTLYASTPVNSDLSLIQSQVMVNVGVTMFFPFTTHRSAL